MIFIQFTHIFIHLNDLGIFYLCYFYVICTKIYICIVLPVFIFYIYNNGKCISIFICHKDFCHIKMSSVSLPNGIHQKKVHGHYYNFHTPYCYYVILF